MSDVPGDGGGWRHITIMCPGLVRDYTAPFKSVLHLYCTVLYYAVLYCTVLYCSRDAPGHKLRHRGVAPRRQLAQAAASGATILTATHISW